MRGLRRCRVYIVVRRVRVAHLFVAYGKMVGGFGGQRRAIPSWVSCWGMAWSGVGAGVVSGRRV